MMQETKKLRICENKGFHMTFDNGWTVSIQWGYGNYGDNHYNSDGMKDYGKTPMESNTAEAYAWCGDEYYPEDPLGYLTPNEILKFIQEVSRKKPQIPQQIRGTK